MLWSYGDEGLGGLGPETVLDIPAGRIPSVLMLGNKHNQALLFAESDRNERVRGRTRDNSKEISKITSEPSNVFSQIWVLAALDPPTWPDSNGSFSLSREFDWIHTLLDF